MTVSDIDEATGAHSVLERIAAVLDVLSWADGMTLAEISRRCDIPRSSLHRILQQMVDISWVERADRRYRLGLGVRELGQRTIRQSKMHRAALTWMYQVRDRTGLNVHLSTLSGFESINLETIWGNQTPTQFGGARQPAHATASGKVLLAMRLAREGELPDIPELNPVTRYTRTSPQLLMRELHRIAEDGIALAREECLLNWGSVAVPVGPVEEATHALAVSGPADALRPHEVARHLRAAASGAWVSATSVVQRRRRPAHARQLA